MDKSMKDLLIEKGMAITEVEKFLTYVNSERRKEVALAQKGKNTPVTNNSEEMLVSMALKFTQMGVTIDGINAVISGKNMAMVTYHGYKNTILRVYPETKIDMQLVREGDQFTLAKESGEVVYSHQVNDPFGSKPIIGAYCVIKNKRGEFIETLNSTDFDAMKSGSKQTYLWEQWASEFWLKSVIKRACKRHFNDIVAEIDKNDNETLGQKDTSDVLTDEEVQYQIEKANGKKAITELFNKMTPEQKRYATPLIEKRIKELNDVYSSRSGTKKPALV